MNGKYTQQELLLLSNFVYIPVCMSGGTIKEIIGSYRDEDGGFSETGVAKAAAGGGMSTGDVCTVFTEMDKRISENPDFGQLSISRCLDEYDVRAVCYTDPKDDFPVVAFRGTGGTKEAWTDNFEGAICEDTRIQKTAADFIEYECASYEDIVVTGHSKGGNLAQYVTVKQSDRVMECVSYDGQGFGDAFITENSVQLKSASPKITSVSAYNDFVNILLASIAGTCIYVANDPSAASAHSSVTLLTQNRFDRNGNFISVRDQGIVSKELGRLTDMMCDALSHAGERDRESLSLIAGSAISYALTTPSEDMLTGCVAPTIGLVAAKLAEKVAKASKAVSGTEPLVASSLYIDTVSCKSAAAQLEEESERIVTVIREVNGIRQDPAYAMTSWIVTVNALEKTCEDLRAVSGKLKDHAALVRLIAVRYETCETEAAALMNR